MKSAIIKLFDEIKHGDSNHQQWLKAKLEQWAKSEFNIDLISNDLKVDESVKITPIKKKFKLF